MITNEELALHLMNLKDEMEKSFERGEGLPEGLNDHEAAYFNCLDENIEQICNALCPASVSRQNVAK